MATPTRSRSPCRSGKEFLIDPGTYAYHTHRAWREYFRGTAAHNTVRVDGVDQSQSGGNFMWLKKAEASVEEFETAPSAIACARGTRAIGVLLIR